MADVLVWTLPGVRASRWSSCPDLLRAMVKTFAEALMGAEADVLCGAGYGERREGW